MGVCVCVYDGACVDVCMCVVRLHVVSFFSFFHNLLKCFCCVPPHTFHHHRKKVTTCNCCLSESVKAIGVYSVSVGFRYPPSSRQTSHEEGKEWLRSHSTGGLQDTGSQSPLSPPGASCTNTGKYHYSNLCKSTLL